MTYCGIQFFMIMNQVGLNNWSLSQKRKDRAHWNAIGIWSKGQQVDAVSDHWRSPSPCWASRPSFRDWNKRSSPSPCFLHRTIKESPFLVKHSIGAVSTSDTADELKLLNQKPNNFRSPQSRTHQRPARKKTGKKRREQREGRGRRKEQQRGIEYVHRKKQAFFGSVGGFVLYCSHCITLHSSFLFCVHPTAYATTCNLFSASSTFFWLFICMCQIYTSWLSSLHSLTSHCLFLLPVYSHFHLQV